MVLGIIVILYVTASIAFSSFANLKLEAVAKKLMADIKYARNISMTQPLDATYGVRRAGVYLLDPGVGPSGYTIYLGTYTTPVADPLNPARNMAITLGTGDYKGVVFDGWMGFPGGGPMVEFNGWGQPCSFDGTVWSVGTQPARITLKNNGQSATRSIYIEPVTGRVYLTN